MSKKRILWIFNHTSLRNYEVPLLISMGYEVYCPKICDFDDGDERTTISYTYDGSLSLQDNIIKKLNDLNFYERLNSENISIINDCFDIVFCPATEEPLRSLIYGFRGAIVLHVFGREDDSTYTQVLGKEIGVQGLNQISKIGNRFWFSQTYDNLAEIESDLFKRRALYMPTGLNRKHKEKWNGGYEKILFMSPNIKTNPYFNHVYEEFKEDFGNIPHVIGGGQLIPVENDKNVLGFLPKEEYLWNMTHLAAMFYHSTLPRHLHCHPLEAIEYGMPLVFMAGGMLDHLGGEKLPGRCTSVAEARKKLIRLSRGDKRLAKKIIGSQDVLLEPFKDEYCRPFWEKAMLQIEKSIPSKQKEDKNKNILVLVPANYTGGVFDYAVR